MIPSDWLRWIDGNVARGCTHYSMLELMLKSGFDAELSNQAIVNSIIKHKAGMATLASHDDAYTYEKSYLKAGNHIVLSDKTVDIALRIAEPDVAIIDNLLSNEECDALIQKAIPKMKPSKVVSSDEDAEKIDEARTSEGTYFRIGEDALIQNIEKRIQELVGFPIMNGEGLQILHYGPGAEYRTHFDYFDNTKVGGSARMKKGGQRVVTLILYLNDVEEGGETILPEIKLAVSPKRGSAFYFSYFNSLGQVDKKTLHGSLPVIKGDKWVATKWIRENNYN